MEIQDRDYQLIQAKITEDGLSGWYSARPGPVTHQTLGRAQQWVMMTEAIQFAYRWSSILLLKKKMKLIVFIPSNSQGLPRPRKRDLSCLVSNGRL